MRPAITNDNLHVLLPSIITRTAAHIALNQQISLMEALNKFYHSEVYKLLEREETKYWQLGSVALFEEFAFLSKEDKETAAAFNKLTR